MTSDTANDRSGRELEIIRSAYHVMAQQGSHRMTLQDVADQAGVSKALLLYHFGTKDALLYAAMQWALERTAERIRRRMAPTSDAREAISGLIDAVFVDAEANREFYLFYIDLVEHVGRVPSFGGLTGMLTKIINGLYAEVIEAGVVEGSFDVADIEVASRNMRALIEGTFLQWLQTDDWHETHHRWRDECRTAVLRLLGA